MISSKTLLNLISAILLFLCSVTTGISTLCAYDLYKDFAMKLEIYDDSDVFLNNVGIALPIIGAVARLVWGIAGGHILTWGLLIAGNGASALFQILMFYSRRDRIWYLIVCSLLAVTTGMMNIMPPIIRRDIGRKNLARNFGLVLSGETFGCGWYLIAVSLIKDMSDKTLIWVLSVPALVSLFGDVIMLGRY